MLAGEGQFFGYSVQISAHSRTAWIGACCVAIALYTRARSVQYKYGVVVDFSNRVMQARLSIEFPLTDGEVVSCLVALVLLLHS